MPQDSSKADELKVSRRRFLRTAAATAIGGSVLAASALGPRLGANAATGKAGSPMAAGPSSGSEAQPIPVPTSWSQTADVVVVGYGGSGAVTAITAFDAGANVLIIEKQPSWASLGVKNPAVSGGGGNTIMNAGFMDYVIDPVAAADYLYQAGWGNTPLDVCQAYANQSMNNLAWLDKMGIKYTDFGPSPPSFPALGGANAFGAAALGSGYVWFQALDGLVQKRGIPILFNTPASELIQNPTTGEILGIQALVNNSEVWNIKANRAVVLTTGSFEYNEELKSAYLRLYPLHGQGCQFCTGDSVTMASKVGAAMWHMNSMSLSMVAWFPEYPIAFGDAAPSQNGWIYVDTHGQRWTNESGIGLNFNFGLELSDFDLTVPAYSRIPTFIIFDENCRKAGAISSGSTGQLPAVIDPRPTWSSDNSVEIGKGWIQQGATIAALAAAMNSTTYVGVPPGTNNSGPAAAITVNIDPDVLTATVNAWNAACTAKVDSQFGRAASTLVPIQTPPFYSMPLWPGGPSLYGGPVRNAQGQVCDEDNNPIPRLYAAGENGNIGGGFLDVITNNGQMISLGQVAGNNAAAENPWS